MSENSEIEKPKIIKLTKEEFDKLKKEERERKKEITKQKMREYTREWNKNNKERKKELNKKNYQKRKEKGEIKKYLFYCETCQKYVSHLKNHSKTKSHQIKYYAS